MQPRREQLIAIWEAAVAELSGERLVERALSSPGAAPAPKPGGRLAILALGKASAAMCRGAFAALGPVQGVVVGPPGVEPEGRSQQDGRFSREASVRTSARLGRGDCWTGLVPPAPLAFFPGDHPVPGTASRAAGETLLAAASAIGPNDAALILLSGGGSALAEAPVPGVTLADLGATTRLLLGAGAPIAAINTVRRHLSRLKGGGLGVALRAGAATVLAISDVHGDDPATIASGPLWPDPTTFADALAVLRDYDLHERVPPAVLAHLTAGARGERPETPKPGDRRLARIETRILAGPADLPRVAVAHARRLGLHADGWPTFLGGNVEEVGRFWLAKARELETTPPGPPRLIAAAAEPTVVLPPSPGLGGRSQQLALLLARGIEGRPLTFLAAGSDGKDGNGNAAGAAVDGNTAAAARAAGVDVDGAIESADAGRALAALDLAIGERATGTNLADLNLLAAG